MFYVLRNDRLYSIVYSMFSYVGLSWVMMGCVGVLLRKGTTDTMGCVWFCRAWFVLSRLCWVVFCYDGLGYVG